MQKATRFVDRFKLATALRLKPKFRAYHAAVENSLCQRSRLLGLQRLAEEVSRNHLAGDIVECGVYKGGSAVVIVERLVRSGSQRHVWLFDVFTGMPEPGPEDPLEAWADVGKFVSGEDCVRDTFSAAGLPMKNVHIVVGRFEDTLPKMTPSKIAFLHVDCDWYEPVKLCLGTFYDSVVPGGVIVFDDYGFWSGCRKAVDEFIAKRALNVQLVPIDKESHYFIKPK